jgi:hypothetical protein
MTQNELLTTKTLADVGEDVGLAEGVKMIQAFQVSNPDATQGYYIGRKIIEQVLAQPGCVGINFRKCLTELNEEHLVYTGVDADGKDIISYTMVTNSGNIVNETAIVGDRIRTIDLDAFEEMLKVLFGI